MHPKLQNASDYDESLLIAKPPFRDEDLIIFMNRFFIVPACSALLCTQIHVLLHTLWKSESTTWSQNYFSYIVIIPSFLCGVYLNHDSQVYKIGKEVDLSLLWHSCWIPPVFSFLQTYCMDSALLYNFAKALAYGSSLPTVALFIKFKFDQKLPNRKKFCPSNIIAPFLLTIIFYEFVKKIFGSYASFLIQLILFTLGVVGMKVQNFDERFKQQVLKDNNFDLSYPTSPQQHEEFKESTRSESRKKQRHGNLKENKKNRPVSVQVEIDTSLPLSPFSAKERDTIVERSTYHPKTLLQYRKQFCKELSERSESGKLNKFDFKIGLTSRSLKFSGDLISSPNTKQFQRYRVSNKNRNSQMEKKKVSNGKKKSQNPIFFDFFKV